jgi:hypothetical protein
VFLLSFLSAAGRLLFLNSTAGPRISPATAFPAVHILSPEGGAYHRPRTPYAALDLNRLDGAVQGAGAAFHAGRRPDKLRMFRSLRKHSMGTDLHTAFAVDAQVLMIVKGGFCIRIEHQITPIRRVKPNAMPRITPETAINVITGMYRNISFLTPVREVNVVEPVKFRDRYAVTAGIMRNGVIADASLAHPGRDVSE